MRVVTLIVTCLLLYTTVCQQSLPETKIITLAGSFDLSGNRTLSASFEERARDGLKFFAHWVNNIRQTDSKTKYEVRINITDSWDDIELKIQHYRDLCRRIRENKEPIYLFGGFESWFLNISREIDQYPECFRIDTGIALDSAWRDFQNVLPLRESVKHYWDSTYPYLRLKKVKRVIIIRQLRDDIPPYESVLLEGLKRNVGIKPEETFYVMDTGSLRDEISDEIQQNITASVQAAAEKYPDIDCVYVLAWEGAARRIVPVMEEIEWTPKMVIHILTSVFLFNPSGNMHSGISVNSARTAFQSDEFTGGNYTTYLNQLANYYDETTEEVDSLFYLNGFMAGSFLFQTIEALDSLDHKKIRDTLFRSKFVTFNGDYSWDITHAQKWRPYFSQVQNRDGNYEGEEYMEILGPIEASTVVSMIYPIVPFKDRSENLEWRKNPFGEIVITVIALIVILMSVVFAVYITIEEKKASRPIPLLHVLISIGAIIFTTTNVFWAPSIDQSAACHVSLFLFHIGFTMFFGSFFAKALLIVIGHKNKDNSVRVRPMSIVVIVLGLVVIDSVILILHSTINNLKSVKQSPDDFDLSKSYIICDGNETTETVFTIIFAIEKVLMIVIGFIFAYFVKDMACCCRQHTKVIAVSIYIIGSFFIIIIAVRISLGDFGRDVVTLVYIISSLGIICSVAFTLLACILQYIFFGNKTDMNRTGEGISMESTAIATPVQPNTTNTTSGTFMSTGSIATTDVRKLIEDASTRLDELKKLIKAAKNDRNKWKKKYEDEEERVGLIEKEES